MKRYRELIKERTKLLPNKIKDINIVAEKFVDKHMSSNEYEAFIWELLKMLDALGVLKTNIIKD